jgi:hypothetical protein
VVSGEKVNKERKGEGTKEESKSEVKKERRRVGTIKEERKEERENNRDEEIKAKKK